MGETQGGERKRFPDWGVLAILTLPALFLAYLIVNQSAVLRNCFHVLQDNLPLTLPILTVVMTFALDPRGLGSLSAWLDHTPHFALGLVSFAIWYLVASQSVTSYILLSHERVLIKDHALLLTIFSFIWAGFCSVVAVMAENAEADRHLRWRRGRYVIFALSIVLLGLPWALIQDKSDVEKQLGASLDVRVYSVAVPYRDPSLNLYLGRSTNPITQVASFTDITATTPAAAIDSALRRFMRSSVSRQFTPHPLDSLSIRRVEVIDAWIVAQERTGPTATAVPN